MQIGFVGDFDVRKRFAAPLAHYHAAASLQKLGHHVTFILPVVNGISIDIAKKEFYLALTETGIETEIDIKFLPHFTFRKRGRQSYALAVGIWAKKARLDLLWSRYIYAADYSSLMGVPTIVEHHMYLSKNGLATFQRMLTRKSLLAFVTISDAQSRFFKEEYDLPSEKFIAGHSAVSSTLLDDQYSKHSAREKLNFITNNIALYVGNLYAGRGIEDLMLVANRIPHVMFVIVGGPDNIAERYQQYCRDNNILNVRFVGRVLHGHVKYFLAAADLLLLSYHETVEAVDGTVTGAIASPLKMFEYMASERPIVATSLEPIKEVLKDNVNALLYSPGNIDELEQVINRLINEPAIAEKLAGAARQDVVKYTWEARSTRILRHAGWDQ